MNTRIALLAALVSAGVSFSCSPCSFPRSLFSEPRRSTDIIIYHRSFSRLGRPLVVQRGITSQQYSCDGKRVSGPQVSINGVPLCRKTNFGFIEVRPLNLSYWLKCETLPQSQTLLDDMTIAGCDIHDCEDCVVDIERPQHVFAIEGDTGSPACTFVCNSDMQITDVTSPTANMFVANASDISLRWSGRGAADVSINLYGYTVDYAFWGPFEELSEPYFCTTACDDTGEYIIPAEAFQEIQGNTCFVEIERTNVRHGVQRGYAYTVTFRSSHRVYLQLQK